MSSGLLSKNARTEICRSLMLSVVLYEYEIWSLILKEEHRLRVLRRIPEHRDELRGGYRKLHNEDSCKDSYFAVLSGKM
jgi:hypothetical protein